ncbi:response regulator [Shewanella sp. VB17]|nr:response regulator [Shewanella sp. VB17]
MIYENEDDILGASEIIAEQIEDYQKFLLTDSIYTKIQEVKPLVILFALSTAQKSIELYTAFIQDQHLDYPHQSVLLCKNCDLNVAFHCCIKGVFDNYFVYQPLYEKLRLKIIVHNSLFISQNSSVERVFQQDKLEKIAKDLTELIDNSRNIKKSFLNSVKKYHHDLNPSNHMEIASDVIIKQDFNTINQQHIVPSVDEFEEDVENNVDVTISGKSSKNLISKDKLTSPLIDDIEQRNAKRILVVDDNELYRNMLIKILEKEHYHVDFADDGLHALHKIKSNDYSLILMDLFMPKLDGIHTTMQIKSVCDSTSPPIIALTGNKNMKLIKNWVAQGIKGYIIKPSTKKEILGTINKILN